MIVLHPELSYSRMFTAEPYLSLWGNLLTFLTRSTKCFSLPYPTPGIRGMFTMNPDENSSLIVGRKICYGTLGKPLKLHSWWTRARELGERQLFRAMVEGRVGRGCGPAAAPWPHDHHTPHQLHPSLLWGFVIPPASSLSRAIIHTRTSCFP